MRISSDISLGQVPLLHQMGIVLPGINSRLHPCFEGKKVSREEEDAKILSVLPTGHLIPLFPDTRIRLLRQA